MSLDPLTPVTAGEPPTPDAASARSAAPTPVTAVEKVTLQRTLAALVGLGSARAMEVTAGAGLATATAAGADAAVQLRNVATARYR